MWTKTRDSKVAEIKECEDGFYWSVWPWLKWRGPFNSAADAASAASRYSVEKD